MDETLGQRLARFRKERGLSQLQVGEAIGAEKGTISTYETETRQIPIDVLAALADYYHVTLDYLIGKDKDKVIPADGLTEREFQLLNDLVKEISREDK